MKIIVPALTVVLIGMLVFTTYVFWTDPTPEEFSVDCGRVARNAWPAGEERRIG